MCVPPAGIIGLQVAGGAFNYLQASRFAREQQKFQETRSQAVAEAARRDAIQQFSTLAVRSRQEQTYTENRIRELGREATSARGFAQASAAGGGVEGAALESVLRDFAFQESVRLTAARDDARNTQEQLDLQRRGISSQAQQTIFNSIGTPVQRPSLFNTLLQVGTDVAGTYLQNNPINPVTGER